MTYKRVQYNTWEEYIHKRYGGVVPEIGGTDVGNLVSKADLTQVFRWRCNY